MPTNKNDNKIKLEEGHLQDFKMFFFFSETDGLPLWDWFGQVAENQRSVQSCLWFCLHLYCAHVLYCLFLCSLTAILLKFETPSQMAKGPENLLNVLNPHVMCVIDFVTRFTASFILSQSQTWNSCSSDLISRFVDYPDARKGGGGGTN